MQKVAVFGNAGGGKSTLSRRLAKSHPSGWPENSPLLRSSLDSYRVVWLCHTRLTPKYRKLVANASSKRVHHLRSYSEQKYFLQAVEREYSNRPTLGAPEALTKER